MFSRSEACAVAATLALFAVSAVAAPGDSLRPPPGSTDAFLGGQELKLTIKDNGLLRELRDGGVAGMGAPEQALIAKQAKWWVYRLTWSEVQNPKKGSPGVADLHQGVRDSLMLDIRGRPGKTLNKVQEEYLRQLAKEMIADIQEVLKKNGKLIVRVNAVLMLAQIAETHQEEVADTLVEILSSNAENTGVKNAAIRGLQTLLSWFSDPNNKPMNPKREAACILALNGFIAQKPALDKAPVEEVNGYRYVRRQAIRALASARGPAVPGSKDSKGRTALWLTRVIRNDGISPAPDIREQVEAFISLCKLQPKLDKDYQPDYAALQMARFLVEMIARYNKDRLAREEGIPWMIYFARVNDALDEFQATSKNAPAKNAAFVADFVKLAKEAIQPIVEKSADGKTASLDTWLRQAKPPSSTLFNGVADSALKP